MFLIRLTHVAPLAQVDEQLTAHRAYLDTHFASGMFQLSGALYPRTGGMIVARSESRAEVEAVVATDPLITSGVSTAEITEFAATRVAPGLDHLRES
jgi:uncharacterized protein YciI